MTDWRDSVSQTVGVDRITDISSYVKPERSIDMSPIDVFYEQTKAIMYAATPDVIAANDWMGSLYVIAIVSCTENYFRQIFSKILKICTDSQKYAANNSINLGSVIWHPKNEVERGAFEHLSLASADSVNKTSKKFIGIDLTKKGLQSILDEFDKVCELRHGIVHSDRIMAGKNGMKLKLSRTEDVCRIDIKYAQLQEISAVCTTLVVSLNKILFEEISRRWATSWRNSPSWTPSEETVCFKNIWSSFHSVIDKANGTTPLKCTWVKCRNLVKKEFNI
jgi:hypothetical protein